MPGPNRTRLACDRCHSQKLRCPKQPGSAICTRCLKASKQCTYSPPGTISTCGSGNFAAVADLMAIDESLQDNNFFNWASQECMDFNDLLPLEGHPSNDGTASNEQSLSDQSNSPIDEPIDPSQLCASRLAKLLLDMGSLWAKMPVKSALHLAQSTSHEEHVKKLTNTIATKAVLETIFGLAQRLIDLYPDAINIALPGETGHLGACDIPDCTHQLALPSALDAIEKEVTGRQGAPNIDLPLANVLVACHSRLLDLIDCFFLLVTSCIRVTVASPDRREPEFDGPEMRVGSFVASKTAAVSMQITLLKHLMVGGSDRLSLFGTALSSRAGSVGNDSRSMEVQILTLQHQLLTKRHASCLEHIGTIEDYLMRFDAKKL